MTVYVCLKNNMIEGESFRYTRCHRWSYIGTRCSGPPRVSVKQLSSSNLSFLCSLWILKISVTFFCPTIVGDLPWSKHLGQKAVTQNQWSGQGFWFQCLLNVINGWYWIFTYYILKSKVTKRKEERKCNKRLMNWFFLHFRYFKSFFDHSHHLPMAGGMGWVGTPHVPEGRGQTNNQFKFKQLKKTTLFTAPRASSDMSAYLREEFQTLLHKNKHKRQISIQIASISTNSWLMCAVWARTIHLNSLNVGLQGKDNI